MQHYEKVEGNVVCTVSSSQMTSNIILARQTYLPRDLNTLSVFFFGIILNCHCADGIKNMLLIFEQELIDMRCSPLMLVTARESEFMYSNNMQHIYWRDYEGD